ncbi:MarR family transcriptional regulator [Leptospira ognonensis]|uniref:MarR family transcriptional regulator n=1 Tax=Leptospira ognonensis TaxID=2484945 RepID=A0A4R9JVZ9_9LEPT|nr:MarR family winged helix-turn-helix transcriptional regulator [Leptospira ognonensis]TGL56501.1 MarR family transcriptional regulator [Leptospira ognonensis]
MEYKKNDIKKIGLSCLNLSLRRTGRLVTNYYDLMLKDSGLRITQFTVLLSIAYTKDISITELAKMTDIDRTTLQRSLKILEREKLIKMEKKEIGNVKGLSLTNKGETKLTTGIQLWKIAQDSMKKSLGIVEFEKTLKMLVEVRKVALLQKV